MTWQDYERMVSGKLVSFGLLDGHYVMERPIQSSMAFDFYKITKEEFDSYEDWWMDEEKILEIRLRAPWYRGFYGHQEFREM